MARARSGLLDSGWVEVQAKVFSRWCTKQLAPRGLKVNDVREDLSDGIKLCHLLELIGHEPLQGKWHKEIKEGIRARFLRLENAEFALDYITKVKKIKLVGIHGEDIVDKNAKLTLGLIWSIINKFVVEEISVEEATARDGLLIWVKKHTAGYPGVNVTDFSKSWVNGRAWAALLNKFRPNLLDYNTIDTESTDKNTYLETTEKAFQGFQELGIGVYLDPPDVVGPVDDPAFAPDDKSVVTQVSELYHYFSADSKAQNQADKLQKVIQIQKQLEALTNNYEAEAKATMDAINKSTDELNDDSYPKTVPGVRGKLGDVIRFARDDLPNITELRAKALRTWGALATKAKTAGRSLPVPPPGLEPETLNNKFDALEKLGERRTKELTDELKATEQGLIDAFDAKAKSIVDRTQDVRAQADAVSGDLAEQLQTLEGLLDQTHSLKDEANELQEPNQELVRLGLNIRAKYSLFSVQSEVEQADAHLQHLIEQNKGAQFEAARRSRIAAYNEQALPFLQEAEEFGRSVEELTGSLEERRTALLEKQQELTGKRENAQVTLEPLFEDLEKDGLHLGVENTPGKIHGIYGRTLNLIVEDLQKIYDEMVANFDAKAGDISQRLTSYREASDGATGTDEEIRDVYVKSIELAEPIGAEVEALQPDFDELTKFQLNFKVKATPVDVQAEHELLLVQLRHLLQHKEGEISLNNRTTRTDAYKAKAQEYVDKGRALEAGLQKLESTLHGTLQEKQAVYLKEQDKVTEFRDSISNLVPLYQDLEKDGLHLEIEHTPASLQAVATNIGSHIVTLLTAIDQAIAREKGLQIPEEQIAEFRETFTHFDKEGNGKLEYYQLHACLVALGEPSEEQEAIQLIHKYMKDPHATGMDFDGYVALMLDRFSKAETNDSAKEAFKALTNGQPTITDEQIDKWFSPEDAEYLRESVPKNADGVYEYGPYVDSIFD